MGHWKVTPEGKVSPVEDDTRPSSHWGLKAAAGYYAILFGLLLAGAWLTPSSDGIPPKLRPRASADKQEASSRRVKSVLDEAFGKLSNEQQAQSPPSASRLDADTSGRFTPRQASDTRSPLDLHQALQRCIIYRIVEEAPNLVREGDRKPALDDCRMVIGSQLPAKSRGTAYSVIGEALAAEDKHEEALKALREAVRLASDDWGTHDGLGRTLQQLGRLEEALRSYREALQLMRRDNFTDIPPEAARLVLAREQMRIGNVLLQLDRSEQSLQAFKEAARLIPDNAELWGSMGVAAASLGLPDADLTAAGRSRLFQAVSFWERALRIDPSYFDGREAQRKLWESVLRVLDLSAPEWVNRPERGTRNVVVQFTPGQRIYVNASINGTRSVRLMLDTGADRTMVAPAALARLGIAVLNTGNMNIMGVTGSRRVPVTWVRSIAVGNAVAGPLAIIAHDAELREADGLLGRDFLDSFNYTIDNAAGRVTLDPK